MVCIVTTESSHTSRIGNLQFFTAFHFGLSKHISDPSLAGRKWISDTCMHGVSDMWNIQLTTFPPGLLQMVLYK